MIKIEELSKIKAPIVWSLHDMWAFTGGCHYDEECKRYLNICAKCKVLKSNKENDLSNKLFKRKEKIYKNLDLTIVGLSKWLNDSSKNSYLLKNKKHINLPNPIDTDIFKPFDKDKSRELWNLPQNKKLVLFGAMNPTSDPRKGFKELSEALKLLNLDDVEFVVFGSSKPQNPPNFKFKTHYVGILSDDISLVTLYSAVDVMIVPSLQENLSNTIMESLSCATPVVGFDVGGNPDMIEHKRTGYLAKPFESKDLADGIDWVLNLKDGEYKELCLNAREKVLKEFDSKVVAKKYIELYEEILKP
jgi:glycosyltransferase involved in cell wall biosynthesis